MTIKVGVLSDSHGLLRPQVAAILKTCDCAIHAGDVDDQAILDELRALVPLRVVRGNNDWRWIEELPHKLRFVIGGVQFLMVHSFSDTPRELGDVQVVVFGHTHQYFQKMVEGRLWLNPGSCGRRRYGADLSMAILYIEEDGAYRVERIDLEPEPGLLAK